MHSWSGILKLLVYQKHKKSHVNGCFENCLKMCKTFKEVDNVSFLLHASHEHFITTIAWLSISVVHYKYPKYISS